MMNDQAGSDATSLAAEAIAPDYAFAPATEKAEGMLAPVVTGTAAAQPFQLDMLATGAEQSELARPPPLFEKLEAFHWPLAQIGKNCCWLRSNGNGTEARRWSSALTRPLPSRSYTRHWKSGR